MTALLDFESPVALIITVEIASILFVSLFDLFNVPRVEMYTTSLYCLQVHFENLFADLRNIFRIIEPYSYHNSQVVMGLI